MLKKLFGKPSKKQQTRRVRADQLPENHPNQQTLSVSGKNLPAGFAEELLNLEMEMEQDAVELCNVKKLLELYATAVEYYESIRSDKYFIFKNKTQALLLRPNVSSAMIREQMILSNKPLTPIANASRTFEFNDEKLENIKANVGLQLQLKEHQLKVQYINSQPSSQENAKILLTQHEQEQHETKNIIIGQIKGQTDEVLKRLEQRKKSRLEKSLNLEKLSVLVDESFENSNKTDKAEDQLEQQKMLELSDILNQIDLSNCNNIMVVSPVKKQPLKNREGSADSCERQCGNSSGKKKQVTQFKQEAMQFAREVCITKETNLKSRLNINFVSKTKNFNDGSSKKKQTDAFCFATPEKENNPRQLNLSKEKGFGGFEKSQNSSNNRRIQINDSPVLIKMNSYGKGELKPINFNWMTASTNNFHTPFNFH